MSLSAPYRPEAARGAIAALLDFCRLVPRTHGRTRRAAGRSGSMLRIIERDLAGVGSSTEGVFLLVGERLMDLQARTREIAARTACTAELLSNEAGSVAVLNDALTATCGTAEDYDVAGALREMQQNAKAIRDAIDRIGSLVRTFDVLGVMTRVESARFETAGSTFTDLADAVGVLSRQIREQVGATAMSAAELTETASRAAAQTRQVAQQRQENLRRLAAQVAVGVARIRERRGAAADAAKVLGARFDGISRAIGDVVAALQGHDIVRQQIEHVLESVRSADGADPRLPRTAGLQAAQLRNSRSAFETSVRQIRGALMEIDATLGEMAGESVRLLGLSGESEVSFSSSVESDLAGILAILDSNLDADRRLGEAAVSVCQRVSEISRTVDGVRAVGIEMERIALNATVQSAKLGSAGGALEIVACQIRELAREAETASGSLAVQVRKVEHVAAALGHAGGRRANLEQQIAGLRGCAEGFRAAWNAADCDCARTVELTGGLRQKVRDTVNAFGEHTECLQTLAAAVESLSRLAGSAPPPGSAAATQMPHRYTMESERAVHRAVCGAPPRHAQAAIGPPQGEDNVEFF